MPAKNSPGFGGLPAEFRNLKTARIAILPVPYDKTSTWQKGADGGPDAIIAASANMELYDIATQSEVYRRGIFTLPPLKHAGGPEGLADKVESAVGQLFEAGRFPVLLGGEHSISIGAFRAAAEKYGDTLSILQIDAHADTRETYLGSRFNHACVMARAREVAPITQVGIRAIDIEEVEDLDAQRVFYAHEIARKPEPSGGGGWTDRVVRQQRDNVYVTIDLDGFDPSLVPATGTPEPGGLSWSEVNLLLEKLVTSRSVVGFDVVELLPKPDLWASDFVAAKLVYRFLSMIFARK
jgi:agmatinase